MIPSSRFTASIHDQHDMPNFPETLYWHPVESQLCLISSDSESVTHVTLNNGSGSPVVVATRLAGQASSNDGETQLRERSGFALFPRRSREALLIDWQTVSPGSSLAPSLNTDVSVCTTAFYGDATCPGETCFCESEWLTNPIGIRGICRELETVKLT